MAINQLRTSLQDVHRFGGQFRKVGRLGEPSLPDCSRPAQSGLRARGEHGDRAPWLQAGKK
ncbi:MAG: hypothetical protein QOG67_246 [Verrucomicrobiota bacterium]